MALAIADASVVAKWFLEEADSEPARRLRDDFLEGIVRLRAPSILPFEVLDALRFHPRFLRRSLPEAARGLDRAGIPTVPLFGDFLDRAVNVSTRDDLTIYDASYIALAELEQCPLYSADEELVALDRGRGSIVHIRDYRPEAD